MGFWEEEKKKRYLEAYQKWVSLTNLTQREIAWAEYCTARDAYLELKAGEYKFLNIDEKEMYSFRKKLLS